MFSIFKVPMDITNDYGEPNPWTPTSSWGNLLRNIRTVQKSWTYRLRYDRVCVRSTGWHVLAGHWVFHKRYICIGMKNRLLMFVNIPWSCQMLVEHRHHSHPFNDDKRMRDFLLERQTVGGVLDSMVYYQPSHFGYNYWSRIASRYINQKLSLWSVS